jgi:WD40 repeat protein
VQAQRIVTCDIQGGVTAVAASADGATVIVQGFGEGKNVQIWDAHKPQLRHALDNNNPGAVLPVAITRDGRTAAYAALSGISVVDAVSGKESRRIQLPSGTGHVSRLVLSSDDELLVAPCGRDIVGWDIKTGERRFAWQGDPEEVKSLSNFFEGGRKLASGGKVGTVTVWDVPAGKPVRSWQAGGKQLVSVAVSEDGKTLATAEIFETIRIWDARTGKLLRAVDRSAVPIRVEKMLFLPDGKTLVYQDRQFNVLLEDALTGVKHYRLPGHTNTAWSLSLTPDGSTLISGSADKTFRVWNLKELPGK